jgi:Flp pilus assembly protein TadD
MGQSPHSNCTSRRGQIRVPTREAGARNDRKAACERKGACTRAENSYNQVPALGVDSTHDYNNRAVVRLYRKDCEKAWGDVKRCRQAGGRPHPDFIRMLRQASGGKE